MYGLLRCQIFFFDLWDTRQYERVIGSRDERLSVSHFILPMLLPFSLSRSTLSPSFSLCRRNSFSAGLDGQTSYANCRFFWPENQLWPTVQQVSWWWVTANFYLRAWEQGRQEKWEGEREREREREGERKSGWERVHAEFSGRESISSPRKNATPPAASLRRLDPLFGIADFFLSFSPFFPFEHVDHCNRSVEAIPQPVLTADVLIAPRFVYSIQLPHSAKIRSGWRINSFSLVLLFVHIKFCTWARSYKFFFTILYIIYVDFVYNLKTIIFILLCLIFIDKYALLFL